MKYPQKEIGRARPFKKNKYLFDVTENDG